MQGFKAHDMRQILGFLQEIYLMFLLEKALCHGVAHRTCNSSSRATTERNKQKMKERLAKSGPSEAYRGNARHELTRLAVWDQQRLGSLNIDEAITAK